MKFIKDADKLPLPFKVRVIDYLYINRENKLLLWKQVYFMLYGLMI